LNFPLLQEEWLVDMDLSSSFSKIPVDLLNAFDPDSPQGVVAFVGSGPSCLAGLPSWSTLLRRIAHEIGQGEKVETHLAKGEFLRVAEFLARNRTERDIQLRVAKHIGSIHTPSTLHRQIVSLPFSGIITTNYDLLLNAANDAADERLRFRPPITQDHTSLYYQGRERFMLHLHGNVNEPSTIIITRKGYDEIQMRNTLVRNFLKHVFRVCVVVFIGFGFADDHIDGLLRELQIGEDAGDANVFALVPVSSVPEADSVDDWSLRFRRVNPIYLEDVGDFGVQSIGKLLVDLKAYAEQVKFSINHSVKLLRPPTLLEKIKDLIAADEWLPKFSASLTSLPSRPDLWNRAQFGLTKADVEGLFSRVSIAEFRAILKFLNEQRREPILEDALSCFPPDGDS
jgi:hypothetical protein